MPRYEYKCPKCDKVIELDRSISERNDLPTCAEESCNVLMELVVSLSAFSLKGGGWYKDGYQKK